MRYCRKTVRILVVAVLFAVPVGMAEAQTQDDKPTPPFVASVPDFFQWTVSVDEKMKSTKSIAPLSVGEAKTGQSVNPTKEVPLTVEKIVFTKTKNLLSNTIFYNNGKSFEVWYYNHKVILKSPDGAVSIDSAGSDAAIGMVPDLSSEGFVDVDWITAASFQRKAKLENGRDVFVYRGEIKPRKPTQPALMPTTDQNGSNALLPKEAARPVEAMIDVESHLPLLVKEEAKILVFSYQPPPTRMLALPPEAQKELAAIEAREGFVEKLKAIPRH